MSYSLIHTSVATKKDRMCNIHFCHFIPNNIIFKSVTVLTLNGTMLYHLKNKFIWIKQTIIQKWLNNIIIKYTLLRHQHLKIFYIFYFIIDYFNILNPSLSRIFFCVMCTISPVTQKCNSQKRMELIECFSYTVACERTNK